MAYQSRKRNYRSRRERYQRDMRNIRLIFIFALIAALILVFRNRYALWGWLKTYFY